VVNNLLNALLDPGTFRSWDAGPRESVITGTGSVRGTEVAIVASDFAVHGGSIGLVAGERLTRAVERATALRLPLIALPASGGTRMQEGSAAFLQMLRVTVAVTAHKAAGLPYLAYLRHPTTGGVLASWASLAHVTAAEPSALIGFLGPRVYAALEGTSFPAGIQASEYLHARGLVDAVLPADALAGYFAQVLAALSPAPASSPPDSGRTRRSPLAHPPVRTVDADITDAWDSVLRTRRADRPSAAGLLRVAATGVVTVREDGGLLLALGRVGGTSVVCGVQDRASAFGIGGLDLLLRGVRMAAELRSPFITVIDTPGAELSVAAEEAGIARRIAQCLAAMMGLPVPTIAVLLGQGTGGGALALLPADRVLAAGHAWLAPLAPEGASAIVYRDTTHAADLARAQGIGAASLVAAGIVDQVIPEAGDWPAALAVAMRAELDGLLALDDDERLARRRRRLRGLGVPGS
jgi:acetyl-CoA carboxylase carboxyl transferase subunit beta